MKIRWYEVKDAKALTRAEVAKMVGEAIASAAREEGCSQFETGDTMIQVNLRTEDALIEVREYRRVRSGEIEYVDACAAFADDITKQG